MPESNATQTTALLRIGHTVAAPSDTKIRVPIELETNGTTISAATFSIDYDDSCLTLVDQNVNDAQIDGLVPHWPPSFSPFILFDSADTDGELDIILFRFSGALLSDGLLLELEFEITCHGENLITNGPERIVLVNFSADSPPTLGDPSAVDIPVTGQNGSVRLLSPEPMAPSTTPTEAPILPANSATPSPAPPAETPDVVVTPVRTVGTTSLPPVTNAHSRPVGNPDVVMLVEDSTASIHVTENDRDPSANDIDSISIISQPLNGVARRSNQGYVDYTPAANFYGLDSFVYEVINGQGESAISQAVMIVMPVDDPPLLVDALDDRISMVGEFIHLAVRAHDPDTDSGYLRYKAVNLPPGLTIDLYTGTISGLLAADSFGTYQVAVEIGDGRLTTHNEFRWRIGLSPTGASETTNIYFPIATY